MTVSKKTVEPTDTERYEDIVLRAREKLSKMKHSEIDDDPPRVFTEVLAEMLGPQCDREFMLDWFQSHAVLQGKTPRLELKSSIPTYRRWRDGFDFCLLETYGVRVMTLAMRTYHYRSSCPIPALLHTCRESRRAMQLCGYELAFSLGSQQPSVWFNFKYDVFKFGIMTQDDVQCGQFPVQDLVRIEKLAMSARHGFFDTQDLPEFIPKFGHLKELL